MLHHRGPAVIAHRVIKPVRGSCYAAALREVKPGLSPGDAPRVSVVPRGEAHAEHGRGWARLINESRCDVGGGIIGEPVCIEQ